MPLVDWPLEKLQQYQGMNRKPADFEEYWKTAVAEMRAVEPNVELVPSTFQVPSADCYDLYFTGVRGARIHAKYLRPKQAKGKLPALLNFHGYTGHSGDWADKLSYVGLGFAVFSMDCRGQGGKSEDTGGVAGNTFRGHIIRGLDSGPENLLFRHIFLDTAQLASIIMELPEIDPERVGAYGGSQGGALAIACAALEPRIKKLAPVYPFLSDYRRVWEMDNTSSAYEELRAYFRQFDPMHEREQEFFETLGYIDIQHLADRIEGEVLMGVGLMDTVCPPSTQYAAYNKIRSPKQTLIYPDFGHEMLPGFHDRAMMFLAGLLPDK
ncbi:acetylxylan esterase [Paenibacillus sp. y28]|uniref:acetylxylan esterase n=1 Tax=Paenibacillus sp. y28 TaxID=3129110 RepID=UPI00301A2FC3